MRSIVAAHRDALKECGTVPSTASSTALFLSDESIDLVKLRTMVAKRIGWVLLSCFRLTDAAGRPLKPACEYRTNRIASVSVLTIERDVFNRIPKLPARSDQSIQPVPQRQDRFL